MDSTASRQTPNTQIGQKKQVTAKTHIRQSTSIEQNNRRMKSVNNPVKNYYEIKTNPQNSINKQIENKVDVDSTHLYSLKNAA